jgi:PKD repeat protein
MDPGTAWTNVEDHNSSVGFVVANVDNGPGSSSESSYVTGVHDMESAGIQVLGYVHTDYGNGTITISQAEAWASDWYGWYGVDGIFFDEVSDICKASTFHYYSTLYNFTKSEPGADTVVLNPGTATGACYGPISDIISTFEDSFSNYQSSYTGANWTSAYPPSHFWHIVYSASSASDVTTVLTLAQHRGAGWVYVTDQGLPNPYGALPSYWTTECALTSPLTVSAKATSLSGPAPLTVQMNSTPAGGVPTYRWDWTFGDGSTGTTTQNATHTYGAVGSYTAWVNVTNSVNATAQSNLLTILVTSSKSAPVISNFTASPGSITLGGSSFLNVTASGGTGPLGYSYAGLPGGCTTANVTSLKCNPTATGNFTVRVFVNDSVGHSANETTSLTVRSVSIPIISAFTASHNPILVAQTTYLNVTASGGTGVLGYAYTGLPAGCTTGNVTSLKCTPTTTGSFTVRGFVNDSASHSANATLALTVSPATFPIRVWSNVTSSGGGYECTEPNGTVLTNGTFWENVSLTARAWGGVAPYTFSWNFTGGAPNATGAQVNVKVLNPGVVTLVATDASGAKNSTDFHLPVPSQPRIICGPTGGGSGKGFLGLSGDLGYIVIGVILAAAVAVVAVVLLLRKRRNTPPSSPQGIEPPLPGPDEPRFHTG